MELQDKKVLVVGSGKSGIGASRLLGKKGALPVLFDRGYTGAYPLGGHFARRGKKRYFPCGDKSRRAGRRPLFR